MKVLVTGHRGFIGRYVFADWRRGYGFDVHGIDHPDDVGDFKGGDYDLVIHLAAWADIRESIEKPEHIILITLSKQNLYLIGVEKQIQDYSMHHQVQSKIYIGRIHMQ